MTEETSGGLPPVFVINRMGDTVRHADMTERLSKVGITPEFFPAVDGYALDIANLPAYDRARRLRYFAKDLKAGEIGCLLSHRKIYQKMVAEGIARAVVLEDDVFLQDDFKTVLEDIMATPLQWDLIRFVGHGKVFENGYRTLAGLQHGYSIVRIPTSPSGAYGYLLTRAAAARLLSMMQKNWIPVDIVHAHAWETRLKTFFLHPSPVTPDLEGPSTIGDERFERKNEISGVIRLVHPFYRFWYKLSNGAGKRVLYLLSSLLDKKI